MLIVMSLKIANLKLLYYSDKSSPHLPNTTCCDAVIRSKYQLKQAKKVGKIIEPRKRQAFLGFFIGKGGKRPVVTILPCFP